MQLLPDFPWDSLAPYKARASAHVRWHRRPVGRHPGRPDARGGPRGALAGAADAPGYPQTWGTPALRSAVADWFARRRGVPGLDPDGVLPTIGSKELVAWLPTLLGLGAGDVVGIPAVAYPTYDIGARHRRRDAAVVPVADEPRAADRPRHARSCCGSTVPATPTVRCSASSTCARSWRWARRARRRRRQRRVLRRARLARGQVGTATPSILRPRRLRRSPRRACSPSTRCPSSPTSPATAPPSSPATPRSSARLLEVRKHAGMIMPAPVQHAMAVALRDDTHVADAAGGIPARRRELLLRRCEAAGLRVDHSEAGLYLWATRGEDCWTTVSELADRGILVAPGRLLRRGRRPARADRAHGDRRAHRRRRRAALTPSVVPHLTRSGVDPCGGLVVDLFSQRTCTAGVTSLADHAGGRRGRSHRRRGNSDEDAAWTRHSASQTRN